ncbi:MAG: cation transporter [Candidatus Lokiarchaeota archaeon]|nr:cation transporter [Candidatus Lokiarchaeota archaeon]
MDHVHDHYHGHSNHDIPVDSAKLLLVPLILNMFFTVLEFGGAYISNSAALFSDSFHDLGDTLSILVLWVMIKISKKEANQHYTFGYKRFTLLGAMVSSMTLIIGSVFAIREAFLRLLQPAEVSGIWIFTIAIIGVLVNGSSMLWLVLKKKNRIMSEKIVSLHLLEDMIGWIGVLITGTVLLFVDLPIIDTIMSLILSAYILYKAGKYIVEIFKILLLANPTEESERLIKELESIKGVENIHDLHIWSLDGINNIISLHAVAKYCEMEELEELKQKIKSYLTKISVHCTIEMESPDCACKFSSSPYCTD